jgi:hypothetical protein
VVDQGTLKTMNWGGELGIQQSPEVYHTLNLILVHGLYIIDIIEDGVMNFSNALSTANIPKLLISTLLTSAAKISMLCLEHTGNCWPHHLFPI